MILPIVNYGHPVLRQKGALADPRDPNLADLAENMLETMHEADGLGLAAHQVGQAIQMTVLDVPNRNERPSEMWINDEAVVVEEQMPLVLLNPKVEPLDEPELGQEGCLSFPEIFGNVNRPKTVNVEALGIDGATLKFRCSGLLARAIQHETDHLNGLLFIDRMDRREKDQIRAEYEALHQQTKEELAKSS